MRTDADSSRWARRLLAEVTARQQTFGYSRCWPTA